MRKEGIIQFMGISLFLVTAACSNKKDGSHEAHADHETEIGEWKEMDDFHMVMAESFHPYKDSSNLEPAKQNADSLIASADKWASAPLPEKFEGDDEIKFKVNQLKKDASSFGEVVKSGDDESIGESLTKLHNLFHTIQEAWYGDEHRP